MTTLIVGLILFLGVHSLSIVNEPLRNRLQASLGEGAFKESTRWPPWSVWY